MWKPTRSEKPSCNIIFLFFFFFAICSFALSWRKNNWFFPLFFLLTGVWRVSIKHLWTPSNCWTYKCGFNVYVIFKTSKWIIPRWPSTSRTRLLSFDGAQLLRSLVEIYRCQFTAFCFKYSGIFVYFKFMDCYVWLVFRMILWREDGNKH